MPKSPDEKLKLGHHPILLGKPSKNQKSAPPIPAHGKSTIPAVLAGGWQGGLEVLGRKGVKGRWGTTAEY